MQLNYLRLLDIIRDLSKTVYDQSKFIDELVNENMEKENMISVLMEQDGLLY